MRRIAPSLLTLLLSASAESQPVPSSWLDSASPPPWNRAGAPLPSAPAGPRNPDPRCRSPARADVSEEDRQLPARGWDLIGQPADNGQIRVVAGAANYDGMCRPLRYQYFVFSAHTFAGTLSPDLMDSRTDGALNHVLIDNDERLTVRYARYAATDPLCCPSRMTTVVFEVARDPPVVRPLTAKTVATPSPAAAK